MRILAIDPGNVESGVVIYASPERRVFRAAKLDNDDLRESIYSRLVLNADVLAIEMAESFGAKVWDQVFKTVLWTGRFVEAWDRAIQRPHALIYRRQVKLYVAGTARANDTQIRNCLIDSWGGKVEAIGNKAHPGPLYGITGDVWAALAVAVTYADLHK